VWRLPLVRWAMVASLVIAAGVGGRLGWRHVQETREAQVYASVNEADVLGDDFEVIASLDQLNAANSQDGRKP
jgi:archaellum component FlaG (FlaF/FlaG flagellin family)